MPNGAQALMKTLADAGIEVCFTNPGTSEMHFVAALDTLDLDMGGYRVAFKPGMRSGSRFVELSIVTGSGKIRQ